jgi:Leucine-rich repeat (LRR) protein
MSIAYKGSGTIERDINVYNSIKYATLLGITVCISAGNDSLDLNNLSFYENNPLLNPNLPQNDSGSIVVGGGSITRSRCSYSNYGTRVNVQGLGEQVVTSGYGNLYSIDGINSYYTGIFDGTSSACPMIAGGIVLIQSYIKNLGLSVLKPLEIRNLLNKISFTQTGDLTKNIGVMPNIYGIINYIQESNFSPIAINDNITTFPNVPININVLNNDIKFDSNEILLTNVSQGIYGTTSINPDKTIKYIPNNNFVGVDNFTYTISDINGGTTTAIVFIDISGTIIDNNNNQLEEGEIDMAKKYVQEKQLKTGSIAEFRVLSDNNFSDEYKNKIDTNVMQRFSMTTSTSIISFILKTNTPQKIYVNFGDGGNGVFDCDSGGCTITHTMENTPLSNEWTVIVESKDISYLDCNNNNLTSLDVSGLTNLATLNCSGNSLTSLEATGLTNLTNLTGLDCSYISLTSLDATGLTNLTVLTCGGGNLTSLDVSGLINLTQLDCSSSSLTSLDASGLTNLTALDCSYSSSLTSLDVTGLTNLTYLYCRSNNLTSLDVSGLTNLTYLECWSNNLTSLDVIGLTNLTYLDCYINNLTSLDVTGLTNLTYLNCRGNNLTVTKGNETLTSLVTRVGKTPPTGDVDIKYQQVGTIAVNESIATAKNWMVS